MILKQKNINKQIWELKLSIPLKHEREYQKSLRLILASEAFIQLQPWLAGRHTVLLFETKHQFVFVHDCVCWFWLLLFLQNNSDFTMMVLPQLKAAAVWERTVYTALCFRPLAITLFMPPFSHADLHTNTRAFHLLKKIIIVFPSLNNWLVSCSTLCIAEVAENGGELHSGKIWK